MRTAKYSKQYINLADVPSLMRLDEACCLLRMSRPTLLKLLQSGEVKGQKIGREWRIYKSQFEN